MRKFCATILAGLCAASFSVVAAPSWPDIKVEVKADLPVATTPSLKEQADGFQRLAITLSNQGKAPLTIEKITVRIPLAEQLTSDLEVLYGGSCMGRTPLLRQNVGAQTKMSSSHMYEMVRLADGKYLFAGSLSWRIFMPNFTLKTNAIEIWSNGEGKQLKPGETIQYEQIVVRHADNWLDLLNQFGTAIAKENGIGKLKKVNFKGWASWDYYGSGFSADDLQRNLKAIKKLYPAANLFQIDAGWATQLGDYTSVRSDLPGGMKAMAEQIKAEGMMPGIWIDGFRASAASEIFKQHPEYFLRDQDERVSKNKNKHGGSVTVNEAKMWADLVSLYGTCQLSGDNLVTLRPERQTLVKEVFHYPAMDETVPLDVWQRAASKGDGFEWVLARKGREIHLGIFNWSDAPKEYALAAFGKPEPVKLAGRHSVVLKYDGKDSFAQLRQKLQSR